MINLQSRLDVLKELRRLVVLKDTDNDPGFLCLLLDMLAPLVDTPTTHRLRRDITLAIHFNHTAENYVSTQLNLEPKANLTVYANAFRLGLLDAWIAQEEIHA